MRKLIPFFSVIIPALNEEKYLPKLLTCLTKQKGKDFEVIIVDGMSRDKTTQIAYKYQEKLAKSEVQLSVIKSRKRNVSFQRNIGADSAKGKFLVFFDADITIPHNYLSDIKRVIITKHKSLLATWVGYEKDTFIDKTISTITNISLETGKMIGKPMLLGYNIVIKKDLFKSLGGFKESIIVGEDKELAEKAYKKGVVATILKKPMVIHSNRRFHKNGYLNVMYKHFYSTMHELIKGPITDKSYYYPMGGHVHDLKNSKHTRKT